MYKMATNEKTYTIYLEVNESNINSICKNTPLTKKFWGYDQGEKINSNESNIGYYPNYFVDKNMKGYSCPKSSSNTYPDVWNLCYDGTVSKVNQNLEKYPIIGYRNNNNYNYAERTGTLPLSSFSIPKNSFNRGWEDVTGKDNTNFKCPTCKDNNGNSVESNMYTAGKMTNV